ncbi:hypothetical protein SAMN06265348_102121 [Pedobacter westerhofensis]|uniref:Uncharacterized protein n=1 Tax=Pedobacter westerhofensis TaxID=425512 RepID=A0A521BA79_9SPHI|nr:hypothetical protein [Pedobacter westerhofensis]SMO43989.1 hypothetical protein SAMN06265348_102121 [Pedobacter westerhofensis]
MDTQESSHQFSKLDQIIGAYADITADMILNKNLDKHLKEIEEDLLFLNHCIEKRGKEGGSTMMLSQIAQELGNLRNLLHLKLQVNSSDC